MELAIKMLYFTLNDMDTMVRIWFGSDFGYVYVFDPKRSVSDAQKIV